MGIMFYTKNKLSVLISDSSLTVNMSMLDSPLIGGKVYEVVCQAGGTYPPPKLVWLLRDTIITEDIAVVCFL